MPTGKNQNDDDQKRRDKADGYGLLGLLHILHNVIREGIELRIGYALIAITTRELVLVSLEE